MMSGSWRIGVRHALGEIQAYVVLHLGLVEASSTISMGFNGADIDPIVGEGFCGEE